MIRTAEHEHQSPDALVERYWPAFMAGPHVAPPASVADGVTARAEVNYGRWVVRCPWCPSAQLAFDTDRRFFCVGCLNAPVSGRWIAVEWPEARPAIEALLAERFVANRNWNAGESLEDLAAENLEHGLAVPGA